MVNFFMNSDRAATVMTSLEMVQNALAELAEPSPVAIAAFVWNKYATRIEPKFIPIYCASIRDKQRRARGRPETNGPIHLFASRVLPACISAGERAQRVRQLALDLMAHHGLVGWSFHFNRCKTSLGLCVYHRRIIELSIYLVERDNSAEEIRDTILHEIAHALVGARHGHDRVWKRKCVEIGARPMRCGHADMPPGR